MNQQRHGDAADFYATMGRAATVEDLGITAETSDEQLLEVAEAEEAEARDQGQVVRGIYAYLVELRDSLRA